MSAGNHSYDWKNDPELGQPLSPAKAAVKAALDELAEIDPRGWSDWYDRNVPNDIGSFEAITEIVKARITQLQSRKHLQDHINGLPADSLALIGDAYQQALRNLQTKPLPELPHDRAKQEQEWLSLRILAEYVPPEPEFGSQEWYDKIDPIPF